jgi:hypothetical protein
MADEHYFGEAKLSIYKRRFLQSCVVAIFGMIVFAVEAIFSVSPAIGFLIFLVGALLMTWNLGQMCVVMVRAIRHERRNIDRAIQQPKSVDKNTTSKDDR